MITRRGIGVAIGAALLYGAGLLLGYEELFVLAGAALVALVVGFVWVVARPNLGITRTIDPQRVQRGDPAFGSVRIVNRSRYPGVAATAVEPCGPVTVEVEIPRLAPGAGISKRYRLPTDRRTVIDVGPIRVTRIDPLGLWQNVKRQGTVERLWVHPVVHRLTGVPAGRTRSLDGQADSVQHGSITFHALREYVIGDDLRHVHWKASAHSGQLMVREHVDSSLPRTTLLVDTRAEVTDDDEFEELMEVAASVAVAVSRAGFPMRLVTTCGKAIGGQGIRADAGPMLDLLAGLHRVEGVDLRSVTRSLGAERRGDTLVAVTGDTSVDDFAPVMSLARRYDEAVAVVVSQRAADVGLGSTGSLSVVRATDAADFARRWNVRIAA